MIIEHLTFTGTVQGMTLEQYRKVVEFFLENEVKNAHHGGCIGADAQLHSLVLTFCPDTRLHIHRGDTPDKYAPSWILQLRNGDKEWMTVPNLKRNHRMVDLSSWVLATPAGNERLRSGTWSTLRYAEKVMRSQTIVWPNGTIRERVYG
jgi:hypothetical protein